MSTQFKESLDREDAPFLSAAAAVVGVASDSNVHRTNAAHKHNDDGDESDDSHHHHHHHHHEEEEDEEEDVKLVNKKIRFRLMVTLFAMILAVEVGICMSNGPVTRIFESIACREYYAQYDPTQIGANGQVDEDLCKIKEVQQDLAAVKGYMEFFDGTLSMFPYLPDEPDSSSLCYFIFLSLAPLIWLRNGCGCWRACESSCSCSTRRCYLGNPLWSDGGPIRTEIHHLFEHPRLRSQLPHAAGCHVVPGYVPPANRVGVVVGLAAGRGTCRRVCDYLDDDVGCLD